MDQQSLLSSSPQERGETSTISSPSNIHTNVVAVVNVP